jgi:hypothetical protein
MKKLNEILPKVDLIVSHFEPIGLSQMDQVEFMNRTDTKFLMPSVFLPQLLKVASENYQVLEIDGLRNFSYRTMYFDTPDFFLYQKHMKGKMNRYKVRHRLYEATDTAYLEIKLKTNKKRTVKIRIKNNLDDGQINDTGLDFLSANLDFDPSELRPMVENRFNRITLVSNANKERVTIDFNLSFASPNGNEKHLPYVAIIELKRDGFSSQSPFISILKQLNVRESSFSKYCVGSALLYDLPNQNRLKPKFLQLNKLRNDYNLVTVA